MKLTVVQKGKTVTATMAGESFVCHPETLIKYHRYVNQDIDEKTLKVLKADNLYYHTFSKALRKLSFKAYSKKALEAALSDAPLVVVKPVIHELVKLGYLDDQKLLKQYTEDFFFQASSLRAYTFKLMEKGFYKGDIEKAFEAIEINEKERLKEALSKKVSVFSKEPLQKQKEKLKRYAISLGYGFDIIDLALAQIEFESSDETAMLLKELKKHPKPIDYAEKEKLKAKLFRRGYALSDIDKALKEES